MSLLPILIVKTKIFGITVSVKWQFLALITFMLSLKAGNVLYALVFSLFHEIGHLVCLAAVGNKPQSVTFELTGMNICRNENVKISLKKEMLVSFGGPFANFILFSLFLLLFLQTESSAFQNAASVNLILAVFNLLPVKTLDGGKILYFFLAESLSYRIAKTVLSFSSVIFILLMIFYGFYTLYITKYNFTMLIIALMLSLSLFSNAEC